ncbi:helix-turn-helix domain-containing protein [Shewanella xiamenensis]|uniref:helix-turn-helix domain-containing protein n=1 Tax=Shewanella xiamenensis TaxID=332186 RepID=UPI00217DCC04|nr:helix-turn-helix domain-containing protein [Shewanella xiamenensis]MCT8858895.1 helix-turn-helix domain-containing protein [Shewanella xiamenensis]UWG65011.1 helix-turn-helix domain-containing protein [Shewanella xiamenensis]
MTQSTVANALRQKKPRPCEYIALTHTVEPVLTCAQIAARLGRNTKTVRRWLQRGEDAPRAFKDQNQWMVRLSDYQHWERQAKR